MTVAELIGFLQARDPSEIVVVAVHTRHGDSSYNLALDFVDGLKVEHDGEEYDATLISIVPGTDEVEPVPDYIEE